MVAISEIMAAANLLYEQIEKVTANKAQWQRLETRVRLLVDTIKDTQRLSAEEAYAKARSDLKEFISTARQLTAEFQSADYYILFLNAGGWQTKLTELHRGLDDCIQLFDLGLGIQGLIDQEANRGALQRDMATLREHIATVLADNQHTQAQLSAIAQAVALLGEHATVHQKALNQLAEKLEETAKTAPTTEITAVACGAKVDNLTYRHIEREFQFAMPETISATQMDRAQAFAERLYQNTSQGGSRTKITVVDKGGQVGTFLEETKDFLLNFSYTSTANTTTTPNSAQPASATQLSQCHCLFFSATVVAAAAAIAVVKPGILAQLDMQ